jgi:hypothetical protein
VKIFLSNDFELYRILIKSIISQNNFFPIFTNQAEYKISSTEPAEFFQCFFAKFVLPDHFPAVFATKCSYYRPPAKVIPKVNKFVCRSLSHVAKSSPEVIAHMQIYIFAILS